MEGPPFFCWHSLVSSPTNRRAAGGRLTNQSERLQREKSLLFCLFGYLLSLYQHSLGGETRPVGFLCAQREAFV